MRREVCDASTYAELAAIPPLWTTLQHTLKLLKEQADKLAAFQSAFVDQINEEFAQASMEIARIKMKTKVANNDQAMTLFDVFPEMKPVPTVEPCPDDCETPHLSAQLPSMGWGEMSGATSGIIPIEAVPEEICARGNSEKTDLPKYTGLIWDFKCW